MSARPELYDAVVIGGGFYGLRLALHLRERDPSVRIAVLEQDKRVMRRASYHNQARVHQGYHYPRSILTAYRSRVSLPRFVGEYADAVVSDFEHLYAIPHRLSKVTAQQFRVFAERIGAPIEDAPPHLQALFSSDLIEAVFRVEEPAFDARILAEIVLDRVKRAGGVDVVTNVMVDGVRRAGGDLLEVITNGGERFIASRVVNATYSGINAIQQRSGFSAIPLQHEVTEMALVVVPEELQGLGVTVMDGPFFSLMPFPDRGMHSFSHVRYTPHRRWFEPGTRPGAGESAIEAERSESQFTKMRLDARRYMPVLDKAAFSGSLWETKTVLQKSSRTDSRPILFKTDTGPEGYTVILGGKIDNIYDVLEEIDEYDRQ